LQGVPSKTVLLNDSPGVLLDNGTWTDALGQLQSGTIDTWSSSAYLTSLRATNGFVYTTPYVIEKYGALMKRQTKLTIDVESFTAGIDSRVYALVLAFIVIHGVFLT
jgi:hypothetical protein